MPIVVVTATVTMAIRSRAGQPGAGRQDAVQHKKLKSYSLVLSLLLKLLHHQDEYLPVDSSMHQQLPKQNAIFRGEYETVKDIPKVQ